jgi:hypothetical protein
LTGDDDFDRNAYCVEAVATGTHRTGALYLRTNDPVAYWLKPADRRAFDERLSALHAQSAKDSDFHEKRGDAVRSANGQVSRLDRSSEGLLVTVKYSETRDNCRRTNKVNRVNANGSVEYETLCQGYYKTPTTIQRVFISKDDVPNPPGIRLGDTVGFATIEPANGKGPARAIHVYDISRNGKQIGDWSLDSRRQ